LEIDLGKVDIRFALMLSIIDGIGPVKYKKLIQHYQSYESIVSGAKSEVFKDCGLSEKQASAILAFNRWNEVDQIINQAEKLGITLLCYGQDNYPQQLVNIFAPPIALYLKGDVRNLSKPAIAVVGSRTPTSYGRSMTRKIVNGLTSRGLTIISGLAWGIDSEAHRTALETGGITGAVFGSGLDIIYPGEHRDLAAKIVENGFWLSEFPFGTKPERHNFPRRNRIISGLSQAVVVVEAAAKSGALVTANLALEQGKDVFAVPGQVDNPKSHGAIDLIKQGAAVATSADDILESLGWEISHPVKENYVEMKPANFNLEPDEQKVCDIAGKGPVHFDELVRGMGCSSSRISAILLKLELAGLVVRRPGNYVART